MFEGASQLNHYATIYPVSDAFTMADGVIDCGFVESHSYNLVMIAASRSEYVVIGGAISGARVSLMKASLSFPQR